MKYSDQELEVSREQRDRENDSMLGELLEFFLNQEYIKTQLKKVDINVTTLTPDEQYDLVFNQDHRLTINFALLAVSQLAMTVNHPDMVKMGGVALTDKKNSANNPKAVN